MNAIGPMLSWRRKGVERAVMVLNVAERSAVLRALMLAEHHRCTGRWRWACWLRLHRVYGGLYPEGHADLASSPTPDALVQCVDNTINTGGEGGIPATGSPAATLLGLQAGAA